MFESEIRNLNTYLYMNVQMREEEKTLSNNVYIEKKDTTFNVYS